MKRRSVVNAVRPAAPHVRTIYGVHAISGWLEASPTQLRQIHVGRQGSERVAAIINRAAQLGIPVQACGGEQLQELVGNVQHQGIAAVAAPFPYVEVQPLVARQPRLLVLADQLNDPHNLGALLRTAEAGGADAVLLPKDGAVPVTSTVEAVAAGAAARVPVCRVTNVARTVEWLRRQGFWTAGLVPRHGIDLFQWDMQPPLVLVVGGETGIRRLVAERCDVRVSIPMAGRADSLNASVAAAVAIFEILRRWRAP